MPGNWIFIPNIPCLDPAILGSDFLAGYFTPKSKTAEPLIIVEDLKRLDGIIRPPSKSNTNFYAAWGQAINRLITAQEGGYSQGHLPAKILKMLPLTSQDAETNPQFLGEYQSNQHNYFAFTTLNSSEQILGMYVHWYIDPENYQEKFFVGFLNNAADPTLEDSTFTLLFHEETSTFFFKTFPEVHQRHTSSTILESLRTQFANEISILQMIDAIFLPDGKLNIPLCKKLKEIFAKQLRENRNHIQAIIDIAPDSMKTAIEQLAIIQSQFTAYTAEEAITLARQPQSAMTSTLVAGSGTFTKPSDKEKERANVSTRLIASSIRF
jgi:hypothetical protein